MFGNRRNAAVERKMKKQGRTVVGTVSSVTTVNEIEQKLGIKLTGMPHPYNVQIRFRTEEGREEQLMLHTTDISPYSVGFEVAVRYYYENGVCKAVPESVLKKPERQR